MHIKRLHVKNYRSIKTANFSADKFNIFVGQNNHGKTNLFEAVEWFFNGPKKTEPIEDIRFGRIGEEEVIVEIEFVGSQDAVSKMKHEGNQTKIKKMLGNADEVLVVRSSLDIKKRVVKVKEAGTWAEKQPGTGFDAALNDFLPKFEYIDTRKYFEDVAKYGKNTPVSLMLSGVLQAIFERSEQYRNLQKTFHDLFSNKSSEVKIELAVC